MADRTGEAHGWGGSVETTIRIPGADGRWRGRLDRGRHGLTAFKGSDPGRQRRCPSSISALRRGRHDAPYSGGRTPEDERGAGAGRPHVDRQRQEGGARTRIRTMGSATLQTFSDPADTGTGGIRPPYRFIEEFRVLADGAAEARPRRPEPWPIWASAFPRTALPIEWAVQLYGARVRAVEQRESRSGYLASVREFRWAERPVRIARIKVAPAARRGGFHEFTAGFFSGSGTGCAWMAGALYFPGRSAPAPAAASPPDAGAGACGERDPGKAPFRMLSEQTAGDGCGRRLEPNPACPVYAGHFPGAPIVPGVLQLEAMIEAGGVLVPDVPASRLLLGGVRDAVFRSPIRLGDELLLNVKKQRREHGVHEFLASIHCHGKRVAGAKFALAALGNGKRFMREA